jgi:hypothetical protein
VGSGGVGSRGQHSTGWRFCKHFSCVICYVRGAVPPVPPLPCSAVGCPCVTLCVGCLTAGLHLCYACARFLWLRGGVQFSSSTDVNTRVVVDS